MYEWNNGGLPIALPDNICKWKKNRTVCIDECIIPQIKAIWDAGFETLGCCCGHMKRDPEVIIEQEYKEDDIEKIRDILKKTDTRNWSILQWRLVEV